MSGERERGGTGREGEGYKGREREKEGRLSDVESCRSMQEKKEKTKNEKSSGD